MLPPLPEGRASPGQQRPDAPDAVPGLCRKIPDARATLVLRAQRPPELLLDRRVEPLMRRQHRHENRPTRVAAVRPTPRYHLLVRLLSPNRPAILGVTGEQFQARARRA